MRALDSPANHLSRRRGGAQQCCRQFCSIATSDLQQSGPMQHFGPRPPRLAAAHHRAVYSSKSNLAMKFTWTPPIRARAVRNRLENHSTTPAIALEASMRTISTFVSSSLLAE